MHFQTDLAMAGGISIFKQECDLLGLAVCLSILVAVTILLELSVHQVRERMEHNSIAMKMIHKITSELMILGFIAFATLMVMGAWNGLSWRYIVSGMMFGAYSVGHNLLINAARTRPALQARLALPAMRFAGRVLTLVLAALALYVFSGRSPI